MLSMCLRGYKLCIPLNLRAYSRKNLEVLALYSQRGKAAIIEHEYCMLSLSHRLTFSFIVIVLTKYLASFVQALRI